MSPKKKNTIYTVVGISVVVIVLIIMNIFHVFNCVSCNPVTGEAQITVNGKTVSGKCFADTGCNLCEPISGRAAIVLNQSFAKELVGDSNSVPPDKFCVLPYTTIGEKSGVLSGFYPDRIEIDNVVVNGVLAIAKQQLCVNQQYDAIFNPNILSERI